MVVDSQEFPSPCVNLNTQHSRESTYYAERLLPRLRPVANGGFFFEKRRSPPRAGLARALALIDRPNDSPQIPDSPAAFLESAKGYRFSLVKRLGFRVARST
jgi:hypothetical protein